MDYSVEERQGVKVVRLHEKRLDSPLAPKLKTEFLVLLSQPPYKIALDLSEVEYADSSGLGALLLGVRQARDKGGKMVVVNPQKRVADLIRIAHLEEILTTLETEQEAIALLNSLADPS
ncbi:MAG: STAS domain-containing protein [candidate division KSB1 bacterium]|nr:STAS domain-containing protein [candidate division KSB1 bacterium]MDZ7394029.1 STAS domain-containing protein [candidate division KSB1 bacterium]MDZ7412156.1 STAS domain-containing protein [candidate division KSB1 bacterium]